MFIVGEAKGGKSTRGGWGREERRFRGAGGGRLSSSDDISSEVSRYAANFYIMCVLMLEL